MSFSTSSSTFSICRFLSLFPVISQKILKRSLHSCGNLPCPLSAIKFNFDSDHAGHRQDRPVHDLKSRLTLWYLYCMFIWRLLLPDLVKVRRILILSFIIGIFSGFLTEFGTYMAMARTLGFLPYFLAGIIRLPNTSLESARFLFEE